MSEWKEAIDSFTERERKTADLNKLFSAELKRGMRERSKNIVGIGDLLELKIKKDNENNQYIMDCIAAIHKRLNDIEARIFAREHGSNKFRT